MMQSIKVNKVEQSEEQPRRGVLGLTLTLTVQFV